MSKLRDRYILATEESLPTVLAALHNLARNGREVKCLSGEHGGRPIVGTMTVTPGEGNSHQVKLHQGPALEYPLCRLTPSSTTAFRLEANRVHVAIYYIGGWVYYEFTLA